MRFNIPISEVPIPEDFEDKEVYAFFGLCSYYAQVVERGLLNLTVALNIKKCTKITRTAIDDIIQKEEDRKRTLGVLIRDIKKQITIDDKIEEKLNTALKNRNKLIHNFFYEYIGCFSNKNGRKKMINELCKMIAFFQEIDREIDEISNPLFMKIGITEEMVKNHMDNYLKSNG